MGVWEEIRGREVGAIVTVREDIDRDQESLGSERGGLLLEYVHSDIVPAGKGADCILICTTLRREVASFKATLDVPN